MKYSEKRGSIKSGDLLAWSHRTWGSWYDFKIQIVRIFTRSEYSHVATAWVVGQRVFAIEAVEPRARIFPLSRLGNFFHLPLEAPWRAETEEGALRDVGTEYRQLEAIKAFFRPLPSDSASECAALAIKIAKADGIDLGDRATPDAVVFAAQLRGSPTHYVESDS